MQCPVCFTEFKNYNSYKVHRWRFHNPNTKYQSETSVSRSLQEDRPYRLLVAPVAAASVGIAAVSHGDWKKYLLALLIVSGIALLVWYLLDRASKEEDQVAG